MNLQQKITKPKLGLLAKQLGSISNVCKAMGYSRNSKAVVDMARAEPAWGQLRVSNELKKQGIIASFWRRGDLNNFKKRLDALEAKSAQDGILLT